MAPTLFAVAAPRQKGSVTTRGAPAVVRVVSPTAAISVKGVALR